MGLSISLSCFTWPFLSRITWQNPGEVESEDRERKGKEKERTVRDNVDDPIMVLSVAQKFQLPSPSPNVYRIPAEIATQALCQGFGVLEEEKTVRHACLFSGSVTWSSHVFLNPKA